MQSARPVWCGYHSQVGRSAISSIFFNISNTVLAAVFVSCRNFYFILRMSNENGQYDLELGE